MKHLPSDYTFGEAFPMQAMEQVLTRGYQAWLAEWDDA